MSSEPPAESVSPSTVAAIKKAHAALVHVARNPGEEDESDPNSVQAMPMVLYLPKGELPRRHDVLAAAGISVARVCLDPHAGTAGDPWQVALDGWYNAKIRKVARRARGKKWDDLVDLPGITASVTGSTPEKATDDAPDSDAPVNEAHARAFLPSPVGKADPRINKLQIQGTDLPVEPRDLPDDQVDVLHPEILVDASLNMTVGKAAAQVGHGAMLYAALLTPEQAVEWWQQGCPLSVREVSGERFASEAEGLASRIEKGEGLRTRWLTATTDPVPALMVRDAGHTEIAAGSATVIALGG